MFRKILGLLIISAGLSCFGDELKDFSSSITTDWEKAVIKLKVTTDIKQNFSSLPKEKLKAEKKADRNLIDIFIENCSSINYDRYQNLKDFIINKTDLLAQSSHEIFSYKKNYSVLSRDFKSLELEYEFNIFPDISSQLIKHEYAQDIPRTLLWTATENFSGIVIYAKGEMNSHGENRKESLKPALFPRIFDEDMNLIFDKSMMTPEIINSKGLALYTDKTDLNAFSERIGLSPLKTSAIEVFGDYHTDIVISKDAAQKILYSEKNRELLKNGKILIICDL